MRTLHRSAFRGNGENGERRLLCDLVESVEWLVFVGSVQQALIRLEDGLDKLIEGNPIAERVYRNIRREARVAVLVLHGIHQRIRAAETARARRGDEG